MNSWFRMREFGSVAHVFFFKESGESRHVSRFVPCPAVQLILLMLPSKLQRGRHLAQLISLFPDAGKHKDVWGVSSAALGLMLAIF
jgi:hypothetical protein